MSRDYQKEREARVAFIRACLAEARAEGIVFGNSGGKDCALVGILCREACENTLSVMMPCGAGQNYTTDLQDALLLCEAFSIPHRTVDLTETKTALLSAIHTGGQTTADAEKNLAPRLRMATLYTIAQSEGRLVAGTGNRSERYLGYFTKWGDGAFDFNPISDLTVREVYEFLAFLGAPESICKKPPSAGLFEGQTDEGEMGIRYADLDAFLLEGHRPEEAVAEKICRMNRTSAHKRRLPKVFFDTEE